MNEPIATRLTLELAEELNGCDHRHQLVGACARYADRLGFEHFLVGVYLPASEEIATLSGYPPEWLNRYTEEGYVHIDPVVRHCLASTEVLSWSALKPARGRRAAREREFMDEARGCGLVRGLSAPIHGPGAEGGMLSVATSQAGDDALPDPEPLLQFMAQSMHQNLKRVVRRESGARTADGSTAQLTEREIECLRWTASGKTSWEISRILNISESTVTFHLRNAIAKMRVSNRSQAVAKAVAQSLITLI